MSGRPELNVESPGVEGPGTGGHRARCEQCQLIIVARLERQTRDRVSVHYGADLGGLGLKQRRSLGDFHRRRDVAHLQLKVEPGHLVQNQSDVGLLGALKSRVLHFDVVGSDGNLGKIVDAVGVGGGRPRPCRVRYRWP